MVARVVQERDAVLKGQRVRLLTLDVDQHVKGDVPKEVVVRTSLGTRCDLRVVENRAEGFLLTRGAGGVWLGTRCSLVNPGQLVVVGGEPRGWPIKVAIGFVILGLVLLWALRRLRRGTRPHLPGAPQP